MLIVSDVVVCVFVRAMCRLSTVVGRSLNEYRSVGWLIPGVLSIFKRRRPNAAAGQSEADRARGRERNRNQKKKEEKKNKKKRNRLRTVCVVCGKSCDWPQIQRRYCYAHVCI